MMIYRILFLLMFTAAISVYGQDPSGETPAIPADDGRSEDISENERSAKEAERLIQRAISRLGGDRYINVKTQTSQGKYSLLRGGVIASFQSFHDTIIFPDRERTEFKSGRSRNLQINFPGGGWTYDSDLDTISEQAETQLENFERGLRVSLDNLLRGYWRGKARLEFVGRRSASLGKRNDVVRLVYKDGFSVEFEFAGDDGTPVKSIYKRTGTDGETITEEDRYAQFIDIDGIGAPFIIDRFVNGVHMSRINYESVEYNKPVPDSFFTKPGNTKEAKKSLKL